MLYYNSHHLANHIDVGPQEVNYVTLQYLNGLYMGRMVHSDALLELLSRARKWHDAHDGTHRRSCPRPSNSRKEIVLGLVRTLLNGFHTKHDKNIVVSRSFLVTIHAAGKSRQKFCQPMSHSRCTLQLSLPRLLSPFRSCHLSTRRPEPSRNFMEHPGL
jgi:hypothetical protein